MPTKTKRRRKSKAKRQHQRDKEVAGKSVFKRAEAGDYVLTFGKFKGRTLGDVDYNYLAWLRGVETHDLSVKAAQRVARGMGYRKKVGTKQQVKLVVRAFKGKVRTADKITKPGRGEKTFTPSVEPARPGGSYKLRFGKHQGRRIDSLEEGYLAWLQRLRRTTTR